MLAPYQIEDQLALDTRPEPPPRNALGQEFGPPGFWTMLGFKITLAGGFYPVVVACAWSVFGGVLSALYSLTFEGHEDVASLFAFLLVVPFISLLAFGLGMAWAGVVAGLVVPISIWVIRLMAWPLHRDTAAKLIGGLVAYLATLPFGVGAAHALSDFEVIPALFVFAHCGLAIAMGQAAGCLAAVPDLRRRRRGKLPSSSLRYGVWQLLALTVPVAVVLSMLKATDMLNPPMALASIAAAFCAVMTWQPATWLVNRYLDRRLAKRRKRRRANCSTWNNSPS